MCRDGSQRVCSSNGSNQYDRPHQLVSSRSISVTFCTSAPTHHPGFHSPANAACSSFHNASDFPHTPSPPHVRCPPASVFPITLWLRPHGTQMKFVCGNEFVQGISMNFIPTPAEFITATTAFPSPNRPQRHPATPTMDGPTALPSTPRVTTALLLRLPATSSRLTAAAATYRYSRHRNRGGREHGCDHFKIATPLAPASLSRIATVV